MNSRPFALQGAGAPGPTLLLPLIWILLVLGASFTADWLPLRAPDRMDWHNPASLPGTREDAGATTARETAAGAAKIYLLGTDALGRDIFSRLIYGARVSLAVGLIAPAIGMICGGFLGVLAGFRRGPTGALIAGMMDIMLAFPGMVLLLFIAYYFGQNLRTLVLTLGFLSVPAFYRVARAQTISLSGRAFIEAARLMGASRLRVMLFEIVPNILIPLMIYALIVSAYMIVAEGALSFIGLGLPSPTPSWGGMIAGGKEILAEAPHVALIPAAAMFLTVLSFNLLGDSLRDRYDPKGNRT